MTLTTYEGVVEKGKIRLPAKVRLPENAKVYVIVPEQSSAPVKTIKVRSPRLTRRKQAGDFKMQIDKA